MSLCPEAAKRAEMSDSDFWHYVLQGIEPGEVEMERDFEDLEQGTYVAISGTCGVCGSESECGTDEQGRPWIHASGLL